VAAQDLPERTLRDIGISCSKIAYLTLIGSAGNALPVQGAQTGCHWGTKG